MRGSAPFVIAIMAAGLCALFIARVPPLQMLLLRIALPAALALPIVLAALGAGASLRCVAELATTRTLAREFTLTHAAADLVCGLPLFGSACFLVGLISTSTLALLAPLSLFASVGAWIGVQAARRDAHSASTPVTSANFLIAGALGLGAAIAQLPPFTLDEVAYHLAVPKLWLIEGHVIELPLNSHSYFPFGIESAALPSLALAGDMGAIAFHFAVLETYAAGLYLLQAWLREHTDARVAMFATACIACTPALVVTSGTAWIDAPFLAITFALAAAIDRALRNATPCATRELCAVVIAVAAGALTKYTWPLVLVAAFAAAVPRALRLRVMPRLASAGLVGLTLGSLFFARNLIWTGNPLAPFLDPVAPHVAAFNEGSTPYAVLANYIYDPIMADESLGPLLFASCLGFVLRSRALRSADYLCALGVSSAALLGCVAISRAAGRILLPFASLCACAGVLAMLQSSEPLPRARRAVERVLFAAAVLQLVFLVSVVAEYGPFDVLRQSDLDVVAKHRPTSRVALWLDSVLPNGSRTLALGIHESYWFKHSVRTAGNFDGPRVAAYLRGLSPDALHHKLRTDGFTHVAIYAKQLIVASEHERGRRAEAVTSLDKSTAGALRAMLAAHARVVAQSQDVTLLVLR